jgi:pimeloyl-ACP methyl ester carboxylesterase
MAVVPDAGHAAHLERPEAFLALVRPWLAAH